MATQLESPVILRSHPNTPFSAVEGIRAYPRIEGRVLAVTYVLDGNIDRLRVPPARAPRRADRLWQHTCFEAFVATKASAAYYELNFSPSGEWGAYRFRSYRDAIPFENHHLEPRIALRRQANRWELSADIRLDQLPDLPERGSFRLGVSAVIEDTAGRLSYWALRACAGRARLP